MGRTLRRVPVWAWLAAIVVGSATFRAVLGHGIVAPFIMVDEVIWSEVARGLADAGEPLLRDEPDPGYSILYPLLISPAYALFESLPDAYAAVKTLNAVVMSLAAIPAFLLAQRVVKEGLALLAALLAVALPSLAYTGTVMTENLFYPLFLFVVLGLVLVLESPTAPRIVLLFALLGLAFATRVQAVALLPAFALAPLLLAVFRRRGVGSTISRFRWLYGGLALLALAALVVQLAPERSLGDLLGAYSPVGESGYDLGEALRYLVWHAAELSLYVLVIPLAATVVLVGRARSLDRPLQAFLAATLALTACLVPVVALFAARFSDRIEERNLFYVAPLLLILLLAWLERGAVRPRVLAPVAAIGSALVVLLIPFDRFLTTSAITDTLMLLPFWSLQDRIGAGWIAPAAVLVALALAGAFLLVPRRYALVLPFLVLALWAVSLRPIWWGTHGFERFAQGSLFQGIQAAERDWIDRALPDGEAGFLWTGRTDRLTVNQNEFFNRSVGRIYYLDSPTPGGLPEHRVSIDPKTGRVTYDAGELPAVEYLLADSSFEPDGTPVASDKGWGVTLWRVNPPLVSSVQVDGVYPSDTWSGKNVTYLRRRCVPGRLSVSLSSDAGLFFHPQTIVARSNGAVVGRIRLQPEGRAVLSVPVAPLAGTSVCRVMFTVTPTAVPAEVTGGESPDPRELGVHFNRFVYKPGS
ncbi:MAG TPA: glycosyltransferase family 39 protein [Gaiellaceae bacterium]|nr:glycosyltransferase family 39 protein [Gaiellaceae bacterium]